MLSYVRKVDSQYFSTIWYTLVPKYVPTSYLEGYWDLDATRQEGPKDHKYGLIAQLVKYVGDNLQVVGSIPTWRVILTPKIFCHTPQATIGSMCAAQLALV